MRGGSSLLFNVKLYSRRVANRLSNLAILLDTLLPKLISGELRVTDVERHISEECI